jgi:hypothetical protein
MLNKSSQRAGTEEKRNEGGDPPGNAPQAEAWKRLSKPVSIFQGQALG